MALSVGVLFSAAVYFGFHVYNYLLIPILELFVTKRIPYHAPRQEKFDFIDTAYVTFNKLVSILFIYHCFYFITTCGMNIDFSPETLLEVLPTVPLHLVILYVVYDLWYTLFHWALHWPPIYPYIHKHHHRQPSPFRGNVDAINVHPFEYVVGEWDHLFTLYLLTLMVGAPQVHAVTFLVFILLGGFLASLNHTRVDLRIPYLYNVIAHDIHHAIQPRSNYGQYIMLWDSFFGTFVPTDVALDMVKKGKRVTQE